MDQALYRWLMTQYPKLQQTALAKPDVFARYEAVAANLREQVRPCDTCLQQSNGQQCAGSRLVPDLDAVRLYGQLIVGSEPCPYFKTYTTITSTLRSLSDLGFSSKALFNIASAISQHVSRPSVPNSTNGNKSATGISPLLSGQSPDSTNRTSDTTASPITSETHPGLDSADTLQALLSNMKRSGIASEWLAAGGLLFESVNSQTPVAPMGRNVEYQGKGLYDTNVSYSVLQQQQSGDTQRLRPEGEDVSPANRIMPFRVQPPYLHTDPSVSLSGLGHWLGVSLALSGFRVALLDISAFYGVDFSAGPTPLYRFMEWVEDITALVVLNYRLIPPTAQWANILFAGLGRFVSDEGTLWVLLDSPPANLIERDPLERATLYAMSQLPRLQVVRGEVR